MARERYVWRDGKFVPYEKPAKESAVQFIGDDMAPLKHPLNGKYYTSRKKFRDETKARGCIEVGNDMPDPSKREFVGDKEKRRECIKDALKIEKENEYRRRNGRPEIDYRYYRDRING